MELSPYIIAPAVAWLIAQTAKYFVQAYKASSFKDMSFFYKSGNMPSSHSALMLALMTVIAVRDGVSSGLFGAVAVLTVIVLYDAVNVRRSVGEQGLILLNLAKKAGLEDPFYRAMGHRITEVVVGSFIGILAGIVVLQFM